ncbi:MAG: InlB B-repeat-containing protein [Oscillospiraceae bacterium]|jgi:hypothetical protein
MKAREIFIKKTASFILTMLMITTLIGLFPVNVKAYIDTWVLHAASAYAGGDGTESAPYEIATAEQLAYFAQQVNATMSYDNQYFKLTADIDLGGKQWVPIGYSNSYVFKGFFDGNGKTISNMEIGTEASPCTEYTWSGLFGYLNAATVKNLCVTDAKQYSLINSGARFYGILAGADTNNIIKNCYVTGINSCIATSGLVYIGGISGSTSGGSTQETTNCFSDCTIITGSEYPSLYNTGGVTGISDYADIAYCYWNSAKCSEAFGSGTADSTCAGYSLTSSLQDQSFVDLLNAHKDDDTIEWVLRENDYPIIASVQLPDTSWYNEDDNIFEISTADELAGFAYLVNNVNNFTGKTVKLMADIDLSGMDWIPIGSADGTFFKGTFEGNNKVISNMSIGTAAQPNSTITFIGLFGKLETDSIVKNLGVTNVSVYSSKSNAHIGGLAGSLRSEAFNCYTTGSLNGSGTSIGGLNGSMEAIVTNCYSTCNITGGENSAVGGLIGVCMGDTSVVTNCYAAGSISGGATGFSAGLLNGTVGNTITHSYWNTDIIANGTGTDSWNVSVSSDLGKTEAFMKSQAFVDLLNANKGNNSSWATVPGGYPTFGANAGNTYTVVFKSQNGEADITVTPEIGTTYTSFPSPTRSNCSFCGWYDNSDYTGEAVTSVSAAATLYAKWRSAGSSGTGTSALKKTIEVIEAPAGMKNTDKLTVKANGNAFDSSVEVRLKDDAEAKKLIEASLNEIFKEEANNIIVFPFDISFYLKGTDTKVQPNSGTSVTITCPIPEELIESRDKLRVVCVVDGSLTILETTVVLVDDVYCLRFVASHFSPYAMVVDTESVLSNVPEATDSEAEKANNPETGDCNTAGILLLAAALSAVSLNNVRKKRQHSFT